MKKIHTVIFYSVTIMKLNSFFIYLHAAHYLGGITLMKLIFYKCVIRDMIINYGNGVINNLAEVNVKI